MREHDGSGRDGTRRVAAALGIRGAGNGATGDGSTGDDGRAERGRKGYLDVGGADDADGRDVGLDEGNDTCRCERGRRLEVDADCRTTCAWAGAAMMLGRVLAVMRLVRRRVRAVMNRTGVQRHRLGGEHREPTADQKRGSSPKARV